MAATPIDGRALAERLRGEAAAAVAAMGAPPSLRAVALGENPASDVYLRSQRRGCEAAGIGFSLDRLPAATPEADLLSHLAALGGDASVTGVILQMPLPAHVDARRAQAGIPPLKDVEGVHPANLGSLVRGGEGLYPCTALSILACLEAGGASFAGAEAVVIGHSTIVGKPTALLLLDRLATVTVCHVETRDLAAHTRRADLLVVAVGKAGLVRGDMVKPGAIVVDVGINRVDGPGGTHRIVGDCDFDSVAAVAGAFTPVPGGPGPVTVGMLLRNTVAAARLQRR